MWTAILIAAQVLGVWGAVDVVMKGRTAQGTTAWALALLLLPVVAMPLYLVFGERRFAGYMRSRRHGLRQVDAAAEVLFKGLGPFVSTPPDHRGACDALGRLARIPFTRSNRLDLLVDGEETIGAILGAIDRARDYVLVQFYIIRDDEVGGRLERALVAARGRGVRVMLLYDEIGSYALPRAYLGRLTAAGCVCSGFRTKRRRQKPFRLNFRNHRKIVVVDGRIGFVGGHNIGIEYLGRDPTIGAWRDTHVAVRGPAVQCLQMVFLEDWYWANRDSPALTWNPEPCEGHDQHVLIVPSGPADLVETASLMFTQIAGTACKRLWLATPYFVPDEQLLGALQLAALRGVDVRLILPAMCDHRMVHFSMMSFCDELLCLGVRIFRYSEGFMHQKVVLSDDTAVISTANLDNRSFRINFEISAVVRDRGFAESVAGMLAADLLRSREVPRDGFAKLPWHTRVISRLCKLFSPVQ